jgi:hypothetical protein
MRFNRVVSILSLLMIVAALWWIDAAPRTTAQGVITPGVTTLTPFVTPTVTQTPLPVLLITPATGCAAPLNLTIGTDILLRGGVNVRSEASMSAALVNYYDQQVRLRLTGGPVCANGYNWWRVAGVGHPGWVIEGRPGRYFITPYSDPALVCFDPISLAPGTRVRLLNGLRLHETASLEARVLTVIPFQTTVDVIGGAVCADGLNWWQVRIPFDGTTIDGWITEGYPGDYWLEPLNPAGTAVPLRCVVPLSMNVGSRAAVRYFDGVPRRLRSAPNTGAPIVAELLDGIALEVLAAPPTCSEGYNWWNVRVVTTNLTGWIAEGRPGGYNIEPFIR